MERQRVVGFAILRRDGRFVRRPKLARSVRRAAVVRDDAADGLGRCAAERPDIAILDLRAVRVVLVAVDGDDDAGIAERVQRRLDPARRRFADAEDVDDRRGADDHAEHRQRGADAIAPDRLSASPA